MVHTLNDTSTLSFMTSIERLPWGSLPLESYVLAQWSSYPTYDFNQRRRQLAQRFAAIGCSGRYQRYAAHSAGESDSELPPQADWESILASLRTDFQRQLASPSSFIPEGWGGCWGIIWLRTYYGEGTDEAHQKLLKNLNEELALEVDENILDDVAVYDYNDDWHCIFEVIPERLFQETLEGFHAKDTPDEQRKALIREAQRNFDFDATADIDNFRQATVRLHYESVVNYLFVADQVALDTGKVLVVFFDDCGRTVRQSRMLPENCDGTAGAWADCFIDECSEFQEADIGPDYLPGGICGPPYAA